jgi:hypothetical protein
MTQVSRERGPQVQSQQPEERRARAAQAEEVGSIRIGKQDVARGKEIEEVVKKSCSY